MWGEQERDEIKDRLTDHLKQRANNNISGEKKECELLAICESYFKKHVEWRKKKHKTAVHMNSHLTVV